MSPGTYTLEAESRISPAQRADDKYAGLSPGTCLFWSAFAMSDVLVAVCGQSPQVITETAWGLMQRGVDLESAHVITTTTGRRGIEERLLKGASLRPPLTLSIQRSSTR